MGQFPEILLADAGMLLGFVETDRAVLRLASRLFPVARVPRPVLDQGPRLSPNACQLLGIEVVEVESEMLVAAASRSAALSLEESLCLILCERNRWTCVTDEEVLVRACRDSDVAVRGGFSLLVELVAHRLLPTDRALEVARDVQAGNVRITDAVLAEFERLVREVDGRR